MVTCYDSTMAKLVARSSIDCILVGDSLAMTMHGHRDTLPATAELMALHVAAVRRGAPEKFIVGDMPFVAHRGSLDRTMDAVATIMRAGAQSVKIEGNTDDGQLIHHIVESGIPVMGHLGLTPQSVHGLGGFRVQARSDEAAERLLGDAKSLERAGCFALVLEAVPSEVATRVTEQLAIPTIGIGAGAGTSGQVLVLQDLLGLNVDFLPKFVRKFIDGADAVTGALNAYDDAVKARSFPSVGEGY
jgi:3-methyl-2-oxobutanoate hydroxymethyltransferase